MQKKEIRTSMMHEKIISDPVKIISDRENNVSTK